MGRWLILMAAIALVPLSSHFSGVGLAGSFLPGSEPVTDTLEPDKIRSSWGQRLNPTGAIPSRGFKAIYFDREVPGTVVFQENVDSIAIKYAWADFHQIDSPNFAAYWVGKLSFSAPATKQFSVSQSWAKSRIFVDGVVVFDASNQSETFTHEFSPGEHVIEVEHINNWHTVEYKVTIEDVVDKLTESQLKDRLAASSAKPANVYYVGLYESGRKDSTVDVAVPDRSQPAVLWLASYEAIDWNVDALHPGSTVVVSSHSPGSRVRGSGAGQIVHVDQALRIHSTTKRCSCAAGHFHCDDNQDLGDLAQKLRDVTGLPLAGYAVEYSASAVTIQPYDDAATRQVSQQRELTEAALKQCTRKANPDFDTMMK